MLKEYSNKVIYEKNRKNQYTTYTKGVILICEIEIWLFK